MAFRKPIGGSANGPADIIKEGDPLSGSYYIPSLGTTSVQGFPGRAHLLSRGRAYPAQCHPDVFPISQIHPIQRLYRSLP